VTHGLRDTNSQSLAGLNFYHSVTETCVNNLPKSCYVKNKGQESNQIQPCADSMCVTNFFRNDPEPVQHHNHYTTISPKAALTCEIKLK